MRKEIHEVPTALRYQEIQDREQFYAECFRWHTPVGDAHIEPNWVIKDFLPTDYLFLLLAQTKEGKSTFLSALTLAVMKGEPFAGLPTTQGGVLWISGDENRTERNEVLKYSDDWRNLQLPLLTSTSSFPNLEHPRAFDIIQHGIAQANVKLVIVDSLYSRTTSDLQKPRLARKVMDKLKQIANTGVAVIVLHQDRGSDSIQLQAAASMVGHLKSYVQRDGRVVRLTTRGRGDFANRIWTFKSPSILSYDLTQISNLETHHHSYTETQILEALNPGPQTFRALITATCINPRTLRHAINTLIEDGEITYDLTDHIRTYRLPVNAGASRL